MKRIVNWRRPVRPMVGKNKDIVSDDLIYWSKCGLYRIRKTMMCGSSSHSGYFTEARYTFTVLGLNETSTDHEQLRDAKDAAELTRNPNWDSGE
jgi:hypothetical protein